MACGGAVAGLFAGSLLVAISGAFFDAGSFDIILGPLVLALVGAVWGSLLRMPDDLSDNAHGENAPATEPR